MDAKQFADSYVLANKDNLPSDKLHLVKDKLLSLSEERRITIQSIPFKSPIITLILSLCLGVFGIDRFYLGDILLGILKLLTFGGFGIWALIDLYFCYKKSKEVNFNKLMLAI